MKPALCLAGALLLTCFGLSAPVFATEYPLPPPDSRLIGENVLTQVPDNKRPLEDIAARYQVGLLGMLEANPGTDPWLPKPGTQLTVPLQMILPDTPREGIVVNMAETAFVLLSERRKQSHRVSHWHWPVRDNDAHHGDQYQSENPQSHLDANGEYPQALRQRGHHAARRVPGWPG